MVGAQLIKYFTRERCLFVYSINRFRHLKLEIALAIPTSNDEIWIAIWHILKLEIAFNFKWRKMPAYNSYRG